MKKPILHYLDKNNCYLCIKAYGKITSLDKVTLLPMLVTCKNCLKKLDIKHNKLVKPEQVIFT